MNFSKYFAFLALLVVCLLGYQTAEGHFLGHVGHEIHKAAHKVDKVVTHVNNVKKVIEVGGAVGGVIAGAMA